MFLSFISSFFMFSLTMGLKDGIFIHGRRGKGYVIKINSAWLAISIAFEIAVMVRSRDQSLCDLIILLIYDMGTRIIMGSFHEYCVIKL
jgi:hypothetical protein